MPKTCASSGLTKREKRLLGIKQKNLIGKNDYDIFPKKEADFFTRKDRAVLRSGELVDIPEEPIHTRTQGIRVLHTKKIPLLDASGKPQYLLGISEDITARKNAEEALRKAYENLETRVHERTAELSRINKALRESEERYRMLVSVSGRRGRRHRCAGENYFRQRRAPNASWA